MDKCLICGREFKMLSPTHVLKKHGLLPSEYCKKFNLKKFTVSHSQKMMGKGNPMFNKKRYDMMGDNNPSKRPEVREKISANRRGKPMPREAIEKLRLIALQQYKNGRQPWAKGKTKESSQILAGAAKKESATMKEKYKHGYVNPLKGKKRPDNAGKNNIMHRPEVKEKVRQKVKEKWKEPGYKERVTKKILESLQKSDVWKQATRNNMKRLAGNKNMLTPIEKRILFILSDKLGLEINKDFFVKQYLKLNDGSCCFPDFRIDTFKAIIECDGHFHKWTTTLNKADIERDRDKKILQTLPNYKIIHLSSDVILKVSNEVLASYLRNKFLSNSKVTYVVCKNVEMGKNS